MSILVTGGAGFIGSNFVLDWLAQSNELVINLDKLTYAGNIDNLQSLSGDPRHLFVQGDIGDSALVANLLAQHQPRAIINFAAESHVDRSIHGPEDFVRTNVVGTRRFAGRCHRARGSAHTARHRPQLSDAKRHLPPGHQRPDQLARLCLSSAGDGARGRRGAQGCPGGCQDHPHQRLPDAGAPPAQLTTGH